MTQRKYDETNTLFDEIIPSIKQHVSFTVKVNRSLPKEAWTIANGMKVLNKDIDLLASRSRRRPSNSLV